MVVVDTGQDYAACNRAPDDTRCEVHGGFMGVHASGCQTVNVLSDVRAERARQFAMYGTNEDLEDGTGPEVMWVGSGRGGLTASELEAHLRKEYEHHEAEHGKPTWRHLVLEEVAESFQENSPTRLREELLQVAALAVSWIEKIDARIPKWEDVEFSSVQIGDTATKGNLDPRTVTYADDQVFFIQVGNDSLVGPCAPEDYTFRRRVR